MRFAFASLLVLLSAAAVGQTNHVSPNSVLSSFDVADVHISPRLASNTTDFSNSGIRGGYFEMHRSTLLDLIRLAYSMDNNDKILGGPPWLDFNRYEILAMSPVSTPDKTVRLMLRSLLADRFKLVVHDDTSALPGFALTTTKKPTLKSPDGSAAPGCRRTTVDAASGLVSYTCHAVTMKTFAEGMRGLLDSSNTGPVVDHTDIEGVWDIAFQFNRPIRNAPPSAQPISLASALVSIGFKLEPFKVPTPVIRVDRANERPTDNLPGIEARFSSQILEFDVADVRPSEPNATNSKMGTQQGGRFNARNQTLQNLITFAFWNSIDDIAGAPKFLSTVRYDITAKAKTEEAQPLPAADARRMMQALLKDRFKLAYHVEDRPTIAYNLTASKPKLQKANPTNRTGCRPGIPDTKSPIPVLVQVFNCQNITMSQFADELQRIGLGYVRTPVLNNTRLGGAFDFTIAFSPAALVNGSVRSAPNNPDATASDPSGAIALFDALGKIGLKLEQTKRPSPVFVIDHIEEKPTDN